MPKPEVPRKYFWVMYEFVKDQKFYLSVNTILKFKSVIDGYYF